MLPPRKMFVDLLLDRENVGSQRSARRPPAAAASRNLLEMGMAEP